ncbi:HAD-IA family hydrolase [Streptomyces sp. MMG1533]|uniref:HAD-IA family hydrolase n=1 Tax=Streptomyces sp. MMG1533 TaxID=1415546 RepID=UPI0018FE2624|nr:HAD-IA family hydrolase [Streptomyces sp. MMG1533]
MRAVLFDLDGVLVHSATVVERSWADWARRQGLDADEVLATCHGRPSVETIALLAPHLDAAAEAVALEAEQAADTEGLTACQGAAELIAALDSGAYRAPVPWAVVTSGTRPLASARLAAVGHRQPDVFVTADAVTRGKPDPEGYLTAARALGVDPRECVVVEDAEPGARAGHAAGAAVIGVAGGTLTGTEPTLATFVDTLALLTLDRDPATGGARLLTSTHPHTPAHERVG